MKKSLFLILLISILCIKCSKKKYSYRFPEDTFDTYATPFERITNKWWVLDSVSVNGMNYTDTVFNDIGRYKLYFGTNKETYNYYGYLYTDTALLQNGDNYLLTYWYTSNDDVSIDHATGPIFPNINYAPILFHPYSYDYKLWKIHTITETGMKISLSKNDTVIINYFKKN